MTIYVTLQQIDETADAIRARTAYKPRVGIILGSGLNDLANSVQKADIIPFGELPNWPRLDRAWACRAARDRRVGGSICFRDAGACAFL